MAGRYCCDGGVVGDSNGNAGVRGYNRSIGVGVCLAKAPAAVMV